MVAVMAHQRLEAILKNDTRQPSAFGIRFHQRPVADLGSRWIVIYWARFAVPAAREAKRATSPTKSPPKTFGGTVKSRWFHDQKDSFPPSRS